MRGRPREEDHDRFLLVEGYSDLHFAAELLEHMGFPRLGEPGSCFIKECKSKTELLKEIEVWIDPERLARAKAIGVLIDADAAPTDTRRSLANLLTRTTGADLGVDGSWKASRSKAKVGFFVVPGGGDEDVGELETLVWSAWAAHPQNAAKRACIETFHRCMKSAGSTPKSLHKGLIGSLLAIENDEDPRLGPGPRANRFDLGAAAFAPLRAFLEGLR